jgi:thiazole/oxazole-forming peptide maturase SagD family component
MSKQLKFERINNSCLAFHMENSFISDNNFLFIPADKNFCRKCFGRRYLAQVTNDSKITHIGSNALNLANNLDKNISKDGNWKIYSVAKLQLVLAFKFKPFEDCPICGNQSEISIDNVREIYANLLNKKSTADLPGLKQIIFSFGFARGRSISKEIGLPDPNLNKLLGGNYHARIIFRMAAVSGSCEDSTSTGFSASQDLAELKALMEYLERYTFMLQLCHLKTSEFDNQIIDDTFKLYKQTTSEDEITHIKKNAYWGINLSTNEIRAIPQAFIFNNGQSNFIKPSSSGFGAHTDFKKSLCSSILELIERDAFVRFWHDPQRAYNFAPDTKIQENLEEIITILKTVIENDTINAQCFVLKSSTEIPVVLLAISSKDHTRSPSLSFGCGVGYNFDSAIAGALEELQLNIVNLVKAVSVFDGYLTRSFNSKIESIQDRMNFYATPLPRSKLKFLDNGNSLADGIVQDLEKPGFDALVKRFNQANIDVYGIDCTPLCFQEKKVFVTRAFSPQLYPLQFLQEDVFSLAIGETSAANDLPHFFI